MALLKDEVKDERKFRNVTRKVYAKRYVYFIALMKHKGQVYKGQFHTNRDAALFIDKTRIKLGLEPVNLLKPVNKK